jgi:TATA-box binding protein (TBP) (component of TFIID and TFIIIB)
VCIYLERKTFFQGYIRIFFFEHKETHMEATPIRVSTITATASINTPIDSWTFFRTVPIVRGNCDGVVYADYRNASKDPLQTRGERPAQIRTRRTRSNHFGNQTTVVLRARIGQLTRHVNVKLFKNGSIQMTGLRCIDDGPIFLDALLDVLKGMSQDPGSLKASSFRVRLINSDFRVNMKIRREVLCAILNESFPSVRCHYEPCMYPGVKIEYFQNPGSPHCDCSGCSECKCHKVTISVFRSGSVIITGAVSISQLEHAYDFIVGVIREHQEDLTQIDAVPPPPRHRPRVRPSPEQHVSEPVISKPPAPMRIDSFFRISTAFASSSFGST